MRSLTPEQYARRIEHHRECAKRRAIMATTIVALAAIVLVAAFERIAHADTPRRATPAVQRAVDRVVGHHVLHLWQECRGRKCAAFTLDMQTAFVLFETGSGYRVTSGIR